MHLLTDGPNLLGENPAGVVLGWQASTGFGADQAGNGYGAGDDLTLEEAIDLAESELQGIVSLVNTLYTDQVGRSTRMLLDLRLENFFNAAVVSRKPPRIPQITPFPPPTPSLRPERLDKARRILSTSSLINQEDVPEHEAV